MAVSNALLLKVRDKLRITYDDDSVYKRLESDIIPRAEQAIRSLTGIGSRTFNFDEATEEQSLLLNLCFYEWNDAADDFEENYAAQIARVRQKWRLADYAQEQNSSQSQ